MSVQEVAEELNIRSCYLEGIEQEEFNRFPADVYARGFIRRYAEFLGLDADVLVMKYVLNQEEDRNHEEKDIEYSYFIYWLVAGLLLTVSLGLVVMRFAWLNVENAGQETTVPRKEISEETVKTTGDTAAQSTVEADTGLNLRVETREKTWLYVIFDGVRSREMMLRPGDTLNWEAEDTIRLRLGNAGGIQLYFRGNPLPLLGQSGEVTDKVITLNEGKLKVKTVGGGTEVISPR